MEELLQIKMIIKKINYTGIFVINITIIYIKCRFNLLTNKKYIKNRKYNHSLSSNK